MKVIYGLIVFLVLVGCKTEVKPVYRPFFDFDAVEHYKNPMSQDKTEESLLKENKSESEKNKIKILTSSDYPESISDTSFINNLPKLGFVKSDISKSKYEPLGHLFREKYVKDMEFAACLPFYNDILIFKKDSKVTGIAKICFGCSQYEIIGALANTESFGQGNDFKILRDVLYSQ